MAGRAYRVWCCIPFGGEVDGEGFEGMVARVFGSWRAGDDGLGMVSIEMDVCRA